ncbi:MULTISPECIES: hypothetical protein [unclassified Streptomyces]|uniref:hypothetical protein n=1 Tax=unclassified Streptomyces TaxID=2593676 RepID=UPI002E35004A|nr:hypothetical protein [Streptomyces sp. NBC_01455]
MEQPRSAADRIAPAVVGVSARTVGALPDGSAAAHLPTWWVVVRPDGAPHDRAALSGPRERDRRRAGVLARSTAARRPLTLSCVGRFRDSVRARPPLPVPDTVPDTAPATVPPAVDAPTAEAEAAVTPYRLVTRAPFGARTHRSPHVR